MDWIIAAHRPEYPRPGGVRPDPLLIHRVDLALTCEIYGDFAVAFKRTRHRRNQFKRPPAERQIVFDDSIMVDDWLKGFAKSGGCLHHEALLQVNRKHLRHTFQAPDQPFRYHAQQMMHFHIAICEWGREKRLSFDRKSG